MKLETIIKRARKALDEKLLDYKNSLIVPYFSVWIEVLSLPLRAMYPQCNHAKITTEEGEFGHYAVIGDLRIPLSSKSEIRDFYPDEAEVLVLAGYNYKDNNVCFVHRVIIKSKKK